MFRLTPGSTLKTKTVNGMSQVVTEIPFEYITTTNSVEVHVTDTSSVKLGTPDSENFIAYSSLTEATLSQWVNDTLTQEQKDFYIQKETEARDGMDSENMPVQAFVVCTFEEEESALPF